MNALAVVVCVLVVFACEGLVIWWERKAFGPSGMRPLPLGEPVNHRLVLCRNGSIIGTVERPEWGSSENMTTLVGSVDDEEGTRYTIAATYPTPKRLQAIEHADCLANDLHMRRLGNATAYRFGEVLVEQEEPGHWRVEAHGVELRSGLSRAAAVSYATRITFGEDDADVARTRETLPDGAEAA